MQKFDVPNYSCSDVKCEISKTLNYTLIRLGDTGVCANWKTFQNLHARKTREYELECET